LVIFFNNHSKAGTSNQIHRPRPLPSVKQYWGTLSVYKKSLRG